MASNLKTPVLVCISLPIWTPNQRPTPHSVDSTKPSTCPLSVRHLRGVALARYKLRVKLRISNLKTFGFSAFQLNRTQLAKHGNRVRLTETISPEIQPYPFLAC